MLFWTVRNTHCNEQALHKCSKVNGAGRDGTSAGVWPFSNQQSNNACIASAEAVILSHRMSEVSIIDPRPASALRMLMSGPLDLRGSKARSTSLLVCRSARGPTSAVLLGLPTIVPRGERLCRGDRWSPCIPPKCNLKKNACHVAEDENKSGTNTTRSGSARGWSAGSYSYTCSCAFDLHACRC